MNTIKKLAESKLTQNPKGWWELWVRPIGTEEWILSSSSMNHEDMQIAADWWNGRAIEWEVEKID